MTPGIKCFQQGCHTVCQAQSVVISSTKSNRELVTGDVPCGRVVGPILFNTFINDLTSRMECSLSKLIYNTKLEGVLNG